MRQLSQALDSLAKRPAVVVGGTEINSNVGGLGGSVQEMARIMESTLARVLSLRNGELYDTLRRLGAFA